MPQIDRFMPDETRAALTEAGFDYLRLSKRFGLLSHEQNSVVAEIESHTGLFVQSGSEKFEFAHKSLQEYLAAEFLVKMPIPPSNESRLHSLSSELAIATAISSIPSDYLGSLVDHTFTSKSLDSQFYFSFVNRLLQEKPDFDTDFETFLSLLRVFSLWFCNGTIPTGKFQGTPANVFVGGYSGVDASKCPTISKFFTTDEWSSHMQKFSELYEISASASPSKSILMAQKRAKRRVFRNSRDYFVLPEVFLN